MKSIFSMSVAVAALFGAAMFVSAPAEARTDFSISIGVPNAVDYDYDSGGYCDSYGCPDGYWDFPVWYGPVYFHRRWYRGPVYYRDDMSDRRVYWIAGGWHHDQWRGDRPDWWYRNHYYAGPALGYSFYLGHGFRHDRDRYWRGDDWRGDRRDHGWNDRNDHDWNDHHDRDWNDRHDNSGVNIYLGGGDDHRDHDRSDHHGDYNDRGWNGRGDNYDHHGHDDHHGHGMVTTTMSPAAAFSKSTGHGYTGYTPPPAGGSGMHHAGSTGGSPSGSGGGHSGPSGSSGSSAGGDDDHHHHHH